MWLRLLVSALVVGFCTLLGYFAAGKYRARKQFFGQLAHFNEQFLGELGYARKPLGAFLSEYKYQGDFGKAIESFSKMRSLEFHFSYLTKGEQADLTVYFSMLGKGDAQSQKGYFSAQKSVLAEKKAESEKEARIHGELYLKLGLIAGLAFVILII